MQRSGSTEETEIPGFSLTRGVKVERSQCPLGLATLLLIKALDQKDAVEVIELMLEHPALEAIDLEGDVVAVKVDTNEVDPIRPEDLPGEPWDREAALLVDKLTVGLHDLRVDHRHGSLADVVDEDAPLDPDLVGRKPCTRGGVHDLEHPVRECHHPTVDVGNALGCVLEGGVAVGADPMRAHSPIVPVRAIRRSLRRPPR